MARSIHKLGLVGATLAFLLIAGLNFTALNRQWDVPYIGMQKANAYAPCIDGRCQRGGKYSYGCLRSKVWISYPCAQTCGGC